MSFNRNNDSWKEGNYPLFLGQQPALYDSINVAHPKLFELYKQQKAQDWSEDEINLDQSKIDMMTCPIEVRDIMIENIALQWTADSVASNSIAPCFAPFVTNTEYWTALLKISEIEALHSLTYSEIVRQCFTNPNEIFDKIYTTQAIYDRLSNVTKAFSEAKIAGAKYTLGLINEEEAYEAVMNMTVALFGLERLQFMSSFQATFAVVETGVYFGIGKLVQKIMLDERFIHAEVGKYVIEQELKTERGKKWFEKNKLSIYNTIDAIRFAEYDWSAYVFSNGRKVVGLTEASNNKGVDYHAQDVYDVFGFDLPYERIKKNPLKYMETWLDLNKFQNAQQEADSANYNLNIIIDDMGEDIIEIDI